MHHREHRRSIVAGWRTLCEGRTRADGFNQLKGYFNIGPVVEIVRELDEAEKYLSAETERPAYGEPIADVYRRRKLWFNECSRINS